MNEHKIAFILCMNNEREYAECKRYLDRLVVPDGFETDVITIQEAPSMCAGYNAGMQSTDAKYKVYIHQDTFIINKNFIPDMLKVFEDENVGLMGVIGARKLPKNAYAVTAWDTGKVYDNSYNMEILGYQEKGKTYTEVEAVDGLLLATQYDIEFREDLFSDFDFYDISACFEYRRAGFKVVVANQEECWVYHNDKFSKMVKYDTNREKFVNEYIIDFNLERNIDAIDNQEYEAAKVEAKRSFEKFIDNGQMAIVSQALMGQESVYLCLRDIDLLARIYANEPEQSIFKWNAGVEQLYNTLNDLKWFLKRVEYGVEMEEDEYKYYCVNYSFYSILLVALNYCIRVRAVIEALRRYISDVNAVNAIIEKTSNERSWVEVIRKVENNIVYNFDKIARGIEIPLIVTDLNDVASVEVIIEIFEKLEKIDKVLVISKKDGDGSRLLREKNIPVLVGKSVNISLFCMYKKWNIKEVVFVGQNEFVDECKRIFYNSDIELDSILKYASEAYRNDDCQLYYCLGKLLQNDNKKQEKLCFEQALYYSKCQDDADKMEIELKRLKDVTIEKSSIVILSYNTMDMTKNCIESIQAGTNKNDYEIIVVDNASSDGSVEYLKLLEGVKVIINKENKGFAGGCNQGIALSEKGNDIWLLNSDTLVPENALFWLRMGLYSDENVGATGSISNYCPNYQNVVETNVDDTNYKIIAEQYNKYKENALEQKNWLVGFSMLIKREALEKTGYLDERFFPGNFEDNDLSYRLLENGYKLMLCHNSFVFHYGGTSFKKSNTVSSSLVENKLRFIEKWKFDPEAYTAIKTRHLSMLDRKKDEEFSVIDLNAGVGATIARIKYMYKNAYAVGVEECGEAARIANCNGCRVSNEVDRYFDYVLIDRLTKEGIDDVLACIKYNGVLIGCHENRYYNELIKGDYGNGMSANEIIELLGSKGFKIIDFSFEKGTYDGKDRMLELRKKYNCDEKLITAKRFYFMAKIN